MAAQQAASAPASIATVVRRRAGVWQRFRRHRVALVGAIILFVLSAASVGAPLVPGSEAPEEIVLLGAHLDSWDITPGALDDAAGCGIVLEAARAIAALPRKPRRTVRVVLFANEEHGLSGARAYAEAHRDEVPRHVAAVEADFGDGRVLEARYLGAEAARPAFEALLRPLAPLGVKASPADATGGADISPLRALGVPIVDLHQDGTRYFDVHHTANDTLAKIVKADLDQAAAAFAAFAFAAADMQGDLGRIPEDRRARR